MTATSIKQSGFLQFNIGHLFTLMGIAVAFGAVRQQVAELDRTQQHLSERIDAIDRDGTRSMPTQIATLKEHEARIHSLEELAPKIERMAVNVEWLVQASRDRNAQSGH